MPLRPQGFVAASLQAIALGCASRNEDIVRAPSAEPPGSTFSIVGRDPANGDLGVAVQSKFFAVGPVVPWVEAGVGAIATQSYANTAYGPRGLALLREGLAPEEVAARLTGEDPGRDRRQLGIVDARGRSATYTGEGCIPWAGGRAETDFAVQGNILVSEATVSAMRSAFRETRGELAERLVAALEAGQKAGGDARGRQSAAIVVARKGGGYAGLNDRYLDLRVDDHEDPIRELRRLVEMQLGKDPVSRARGLAREGKADEALAVLGKAIEERPGAAAARFEKARLLLESGRKDEGRRENEAAVATDPAYDHHRYLAARLLASAGLDEAALAEAKRALELNPEYAHAFRRALEERGNPLGRLRGEIEKLLPGK
jgi:uncharacterized Ntn-hydrolase superfamily protein